MAEHQNGESKVSYKETLNLPHTVFPIRAQAQIDDPAIIKRWEEEKLSNTSFHHNQGNKKFILHDGPPYSNGHIHLGHAYNKILKDIITKSQRMFGKHVPVMPGWDCHGLPIELKVSQETPGLDRASLKKACRAYAQRWIDIQREEFKKLGVLMNWDHPYTTMDFSYEASIMRVFGKFVQDGYIERKNKTVSWCASCQTVLATAEIEYNDRKDPSVYVLFLLKQDVTNALFSSLRDKTVSFVIWTTTPWTLPLNRAVILKPQADYVVLDTPQGYVIVGEKRVQNVCKVANIEPKIVAKIDAESLVNAGALVQHPFEASRYVPVILDTSVSLEDGTAFVHIAPGVGPEDYELGVKNNLEIFSPISPDGRYTTGISPIELEGMSVTDGQIWVIKKLAETKKLFAKQSITHSYPHCWRCRNGLIFRATKQWFCDLSRNNLKERALTIIDTINTVPKNSINRLKSTLEGRLEWCLSRQRIWGVPIPALLCNNCDYSYTNQQFIDGVAQEVEKHGIEYWDEVSLESVLPAGLTCPGCKETSFKKEQDILDVWFESGVSHYAVLKHYKDLAFPADVYCEGSDQHRAWFQSSVLTSTVLNNETPMRTIVTHGFTVDEQGRKMSKSLGNVVAPQQIVDTLGTDGLRLWVSSLDCAGEAVVSDTLLRNIQEVYRKIRNTCRFLISNLYDFDIEKDAVPLDELLTLDQYALQELFEAHFTILKGYASYDVTTVFHTMSEYCAVNLSSFYLDIVKDRLYVALANGHERRSAQTVCWYILDTLTKLMAPVLSFTAEQISDYYQKNKTQSIHLQSFADLGYVWDILERFVAKESLDVIRGGDFTTFADVERITFIREHEERWEVIKAIRSAILKAIEEQRAQNRIKHSLEACVTIHIAHDASFIKVIHAFFEELEQRDEKPEEFFKELVIVSQFAIMHHKQDIPESSYKGLYIQVTIARGIKCPRCWQWQESTHEHGLCNRCVNIIKHL